MPSTYTNLGLEKQATGENANTWGDITNTNIDMVDEALSGIYSISSSATSQTVLHPRTGLHHSKHDLPPIYIAAPHPVRSLLLYRRGSRKLSTSSTITATTSLSK